MLKHLKMKAAISQQEKPKNDLEEVILSEDVEFIGKTKIVEEDIAGKHVYRTSFIGPLELPMLNTHQSGSKRIIENNAHNGNSSNYDKGLLSPVSDIHKWEHISDAHIDMSTHSSDAIYYKSACPDPSCHCSPRKIYPHSPKLEEFCYCLSCQQMPRLMHHTRVPYYHSSAHFPEGSTHLHHPTSGVFYPPESNIGHPHPSYHSPTLGHHSGADWARYAEPGFGQVTHNLFNPGSYNQQPWKVPQSSYSGRFSRTSASKDVIKLSLPLSRPTIVSLVKSGKCDVILEILDGPLHNESSPLYPLALRTVLEILDVIEKDFTKAYQSDRKVEADIHQLSDFVRNMEKTNCGESSVNYMDHQKVLTTLPQPTKIEVAAQFPDISSVFLDETSNEKKEHMPEQKTKSAGARVASEAMYAHGTASPHNDTDERKKPLLGNYNRESIIIGDDIANILAAFKAKSIPPISTTNSAGNLKQIEEQGNSRANDKCEVAADPKEDNMVESHPQTIKNDIPFPKEGKKDGPEESEKNNPDTVPCEKDREGWDPTTTIATSQSTDLQKDQLDLDVVDALLDQTLHEADKARDDPTKSAESVNNESMSGYRGKGFKIRSIRNTDKGQRPLAKTKVPVKTFAQIREKDLLVLNCQEKDTSKLPNQSTDSQVGVDKETKDMNGNTLEVPFFIHDNSKPAIPKDCKETTPELPRCPSNPLSPSPSDSLDNTDFKSMLFKKREGDCAVGKTEISKPVVKLGDNSGMVSVDSVPKHSSKEPMQKELSEPTEPVPKTLPVQETLPVSKALPVPKRPDMTDKSKESTLPNSIGKPLISKSFHGKLLLQKNSKDDPYSIPLEVTDLAVVLRDPRLALSNLMDYRGNHEFTVLHWKDVTSNNNPKVPDAPSISSINVRDPRVRRRLSGDSCSGALVQANDQRKPSTKEDPTNEENLPREHHSERNSMHRPSVDCRSASTEKLIKTELSTHQSADKVGSSLIKKITACIRDSRLASNAVSTSDTKTGEWDKKHHVKSVIVADDFIGKEDIDRPKRSSVVGPLHESMAKPDPKCSSQQHVKSVIVVGECAKKGNAEKPKIASSLGPPNESVEKMDTKFSFQESLSVLKGIKSDIKKELNTSGGKMEKVDKDKINILSQRIAVLARAVEISLLTTEVQKKKATGKKMDMLIGILEDHFILTADLIIMGLWLKDETPSGNGKGLPDFRKGVFSRKTAPSLKRIHKWLKNRYEIDGFTDKALSKLVSMIAGEGEEQRSRSRSSSTGSDRHKRKRSESSQNSERTRIKNIDKKSDDAHHRKSEDNTKVTKEKLAEDSKGKPTSTKSSKHEVSSAEKEEVPSKKSPGTPESDYESANDYKESSVNSGFSSSESEEGNLKSGKGSVKRMTTGEDGKVIKKCKQSVTVSNCIQDLPQEMSDIKREVLIALSDRNTKIANKCLEKLPEMSRKAHAQLDDENKTYTSLKNVSPDTRAKFNDVIKGIQRLIVDCEIMIYSLSWNANRIVARKAKDIIWTIAQKSSHKPSYEEELALLLSLRKSYTSTDLWMYIKNDVDDRIASLQKKCRSSQKIAALIQDYPISDRKPNWPNASQTPQYSAGGPSQDAPPMQASMPVHQGYDRGPEVRYNGPSDKNFGYQNSYIPSVVRNNFVDRPVEQFPPSNAMPYHREGYPLPNPPNHHVTFQPHPAPPPPPPPPPREEPRNYEWWRYEKRPDDWDARSGKSSTGSYEYDGGNMYTPPRML